MRMTEHRECRPGRAGQILRSGPPLVGSGKRVPAPAPDQSAAAGLDRRHCPAARASACSMSAAAAASWPTPWRAKAPRCWASTWRPRPCKVAQLHALEAQTPNVEYREVSAEALAAEQPGSFDVVTCMEMLEHVPDPASVVRGLRDAGQAGRLGVFFHHQPQSEVLPARHRRRRVRAEHAAARHPRIRQVHPAQRAGGLLPRCRTGAAADARHGIQPADAALLAERRHQRQLPVRHAASREA